MAAFDDDLRLAHVLADAADDISLRLFRSLDLRSILSRARPRDAVVGEEYGTSGNSARRWVVDPIDGTKNYVRGVPVWATLIALLEGDQPVVGVVSAPALNRRWWASKGGGAWSGRSLAKATRCRVSAVSRLEDASLSFSSLTGWEEQGRLDYFLDLTRSVWRTARSPTEERWCAATGCCTMPCSPSSTAAPFRCAGREPAAAAGFRQRRHW